MKEDTELNGAAYISERLDDQLKYLEQNSALNKRRYETLKTAGITCNVLTTLFIALAFSIPEHYRIYGGMLALFTSAIVLFTYQWEEFKNYGVKWEKFRLVAEQLKSERFLYRTGGGRYTSLQAEDKKLTLVETTEQILRGTDISFFSMMVEPGRRIEKRLGGSPQV